MITNTRYEILVKVYTEFDFEGNPIQSSATTYTLDTYDYEMVTFDMSINEIQDISTRNSTSSKTITIPDTNNNRTAFGYISNLNVDSNLYNPNKRAECIIFVDTVPVYTGTLQFRKIVYDFKTGENKFEVVFFSSVLDFYKNVGEKYLTGLTGLSRLNHVYNVDNIMYSWTQSQSHGYYYPLIDYGRIYNFNVNRSNEGETPWGFDYDNMGGKAPLYSGSVKVQQFYPAIYVKTLVDQIFSDAGYIYQSSFFNSDKFRRMVIPFMNKFLKSDFDRNLLQSKMTLEGDSYKYQQIDGTFLNRFITISGFTYSPGSTAIHSATMSNFNNIEYHYYYNNILGSGFDTIYFNTQAGYYINNQDYSIDYSPSVNFTIIGLDNFTNRMKHLINGGPIVLGLIMRQPLEIVWATQKPGATYSRVIARQLLKDISGSSILDNNTYSTNGYSNAASWIPEPTVPNLINSNGYYTLEPGEKSFIFFMSRFDGTSAFISLPNYIFNITGDIKDNVSEILTEGAVLNVPKNLPENIKQKDFLTSLYKMFNLYVEPDKIVTNLLRIETRDDYYRFDSETGDVVIKDWTSKIDLDQPIELDILSDTQNKTIIYTYKEDKDYFNELYKVNTNRIQGDIIKEIDNDFTTGEKKVELMFGPSVLANIPGYNNFPVVNLSKQISDTKGYPVGSTDINIRILYKTYSNLVYDDIWKFSNNSGTYSFTMSSYPYAGVYDDPYFSTSDLSFSQPLVNFYYNPNIITDNLFNTYHENQFKELNDVSSRMLTCEMYLTPKDISDFYFNHIIYLEVGGNGSYWRVNSIKNYDITGRSTCTVELIKALYPNVNLPTPPQPTTTTTSTTTTTTTLGPQESTIVLYPTVSDRGRYLINAWVSSGFVGDNLTITGYVQSYSDSCTTILGASCSYSVEVPFGSIIDEIFIDGPLCIVPGTASTISINEIVVNGVGITASPSTIMIGPNTYTIEGLNNCVPII